MMQLYTTPLPEASMPEISDRQRSELAEAGLLSGGESVVEQLTSDATRTDLRGQYKYDDPDQIGYSKMMAEELEELAKSSIDTLPLFRDADDREWGGRGYYEVQSANTDPPHPNREDVYEYDLTLTKVGTTGSHYRAVVTNPRDDVVETNPYAAGDPTLIGVPTSARKVQWVHSQTKTTRTPASPVETRASSGVDHDVYDLADYPYDAERPLLVYQADLHDDMLAGTIIYDTHDRASKRTDSGARQWQVVHSTEHPIDHEIVMTNGLLRLRLDEANGTLEAEEWDPDATTSTLSFDAESNEGAWVDVGLSQPSTIDLFDVDISEIGMVRAEAQLTFDVDGSLYSLDVSLQQGHETALFEIPQSESDAIPSDLETWLEPIASGAETDAQPTKALTRKRDVRQ